MSHVHIGYISVGYGAVANDNEIVIGSSACEKYESIKLGHVDVLNLVNRLERLEAYIAHHPALVDFDAMEAATEKAMAAVASDETDLSTHRRREARLN